MTESSLAIFPFMADVGTNEAMRRLNTTAPTIRKLVDRSALKGRKEERGKRFVWRIDERSIDRYLKENGPFDRRQSAKLARLDQLEHEVTSLREAVSAVGIALPPPEAAARERERDDLRARVVA